MSGTTTPFPISTGEYPNWYAGYVPPAPEWLSWWSRKLDTDDPLFATGPWLSLSGGVMVGPITLAGPPTQPLQPATKAYVDAITPASGPFLPISGGRMTGILTLQTDPVNVLDAVTKQYADAIDGRARAAQGTASGAVQRTGDTMTGVLTLSANPIAPLAAAPKQYVDLMLPLTGGVVTGNLQINGQVVLAATGSNTGTFVTGPLYVNPYNSWEWNFNTDTSGNHIQTFRSGWFDLWSASNGTRSWAGPGGTLMILDGSGTLDVQTAINTGVVNIATLNLGGNAGINGNITVVGSITGGAISGSSVSSSGNVNAAGALTSGAGGVSTGGDIQMNGHSLRSIGTVNPSSATTFGGDINMTNGNLVFSGGWYIHFDGGAFVFNSPSSGRIASLDANGNLRLAGTVAQSVAP